MVTHSYYTASITGTPYKWVRISGHFSLPITSPAICYGLIIHNCVFFSNFFQILFSRIAIALPSYSSRRSKLTLMVKKFDRVCVNGNKKPVYRLLSAGSFSHCVFFCTSLTHPDKIVFLAWIAQCLIHLLTRVKGMKVSLYTVIFHTKIKETDLMVCRKKTFNHDRILVSPFSKYVLKDNNTCVWYIEYTDVLGSVSLINWCRIHLWMKQYLVRVKVTV